MEKMKETVCWFLKWLWKKVNAIVDFLCIEDDSSCHRESRDE